jgi:hypothetical protein
VNAPGFTRRGFLQLSAASVGTLAIASSRSVALVSNSEDAVAASVNVTWAAQQLEQALAQRGITLRRFRSIAETPPADFCLLAAAADAAPAAAVLRKAAIVVPAMPESLALVPWSFEGRTGVLACGRDARGLMYALLELADRVRHAEDALQTLTRSDSVVEQPFNQVRSIGRLFVSEVEDKSWFNDYDFWPPYLSMLAAQRFNRFHLSFGIGYDSLQGVTDSYLLFAYPFLLPVPGYEVRAVNLPDSERDHNLQMLQFISNQTAARGMDFQLGIWTHGYQWIDSPRANYTIEGLSADNHAAYCRDALAALLRACPAITGVTLRTHGESGVHEGSSGFWNTVFDGVARCGRRVEIDLHTKGLDRTMTDGALASGVPVRLSPKYWAEHMGMSYHQAAIRELEMPREHSHPEDFSALSTGSRSFTRYGYADFLREDRPYSVMYRIWPGSHRLLLTGDPVTAAANARAFRFCGGNGAEYFEPLAFKGRRGSGIPGGRCAYADASLMPRWDWEKYGYTYRLWGRLLYNPDSDAQVWRRYLRQRHAAKAAAVEAALANATRILPLVTSAHLPSAANDTYFPECYTNQPIADSSAPHPYGDTPSPKVFGNVSPLDPQLFQSVRDCIDERIAHRRSGRYSPLEVAQWLQELAGAAQRHLHEALSFGGGTGDPELRRVVADVRIQIGIGRFFAAKLRSASLYTLHARSGNRAALVQAVQEYRRAREIWSQFAAEARTVYVADITVGPLPHQRGCWLDRLPAIDSDLAVMAAQLESAGGVSTNSDSAVAILAALDGSERAAASCRHVPSPHFTAHEPLPVLLRVIGDAHPASIVMYYRHVNQSEDYQSVELERVDSDYRALIPAAYTDSDYPLQYFFVLTQQSGDATLYPGFTHERANQPYFVMRRSAGTLVGDEDAGDLTVPRG